MNDIYREQYRQPKDEFSELFFRIWRTSGRGRIVDEEVESQYRRILGSIPIARLQACYDEYCETTETNAMPSPGRLRAIYSRRKQVRDEKIRERGKAPRPALSARDKAWRKSQSMLAQKMCGMTIEQPKSGFDPKDIVNAAMLEDIGPEPMVMDTQAHRRWDAERFKVLRRLFEEECEI